MDKVHVIFISSVKLAENSAAAITLRRHLEDVPEVLTESRPADLCEIFPASFLFKLLRRMSRTRLSRYTEAIECILHDFLPAHLRLQPPSTDPKRTVVMTLAFRNGWMVAERYARHHGLPLIVRFDDWWPDIAPVPLWMRPYIEKRFRALHASASVSLCISDGMRAALGDGTHSTVILPIPEAERIAPPPRTPLKRLRICYLGNLYDYGPMLAELALAAENDDSVEIEFRGGEPRWPEDLKVRLRARNQLHGFQEGCEFKRWFESFDAYLVAMFFEPGQRRRTETCFATKLLDYSSLGRPVIIWAPESASVVKWAQSRRAALCVTDSDPKGILAAAATLAADAQLRADLGNRMREAYESEFSPETLQKRFLTAISSATPG